MKNITLKDIESIAYAIYPGLIDNKLYFLFWKFIKNITLKDIESIGYAIYPG